MKLLIAGSRSITDYTWFKNIIMHTLHKYDITGIISGGASGVDTMARMLAEDLGVIPFVELRPDWDTLGKRAGFVRNIALVEQCDCAFIVWDGKSKGTNHTLSLLEASKKPYICVTNKWY